jgi:squalene-hopene/tetraprenyl-beta-curcumene cyclase
MLLFSTVYFFLIVDWFLKDIGEPIDSEPMKKAKKFILDHGGIEGAQVMTKFKLAAFGVYEWILLPYVPLFLFKN